jgi:hypothetical protein
MPPSTLTPSCSGTTSLSADANGYAAGSYGAEYYSADGGAWGTPVHTATVGSGAAQAAPRDSGAYYDEWQGHSQAHPYHPGAASAAGGWNGFAGQYAGGTGGGATYGSQPVHHQQQQQQQHQQQAAGGQGGMGYNGHLQGYYAGYASGGAYGGPPQYGGVDPYGHAAQSHGSGGVGASGGGYYDAGGWADQAYGNGGGSYGGSRGGYDGGYNGGYGGSYSGSGGRGGHAYGGRHGVGGMGQPPPPPPLPAGAGFAQYPRDHPHMRDAMRSAAGMPAGGRRGGRRGAEHDRPGSGGAGGGGGLMMAMAVPDRHQHYDRPPVRSALLEEYRNGMRPVTEVAQLRGHIAEFACDQYGSRFLQSKVRARMASTRPAALPWVPGRRGAGLTAR